MGLMEAAQYADIDPLRGVSSNIMVGQMPPIGTGCFDLFLDEEMLKNVVTIEAINVGGLEGGMTPYAHSGMSPFPHSPYAGGATPYTEEQSPYLYSPTPSHGGTPYGDSAFSPIAQSPYSDTGSFSPYSASSPAYMPSSPTVGEYSPSSPAYNSGGYSPSSPA